MASFCSAGDQIPVWARRAGKRSAKRAPPQTLQSPELLFLHDEVKITVYTIFPAYGEDLITRKRKEGRKEN